MANKDDGSQDDKGHEVKVHIKDVAAPGESAPGDSAKPIIVTNRPIMKDTMVKGESDDSNNEKGPTLSRSVKEAVIQPLAEAEEPPTETADTEPSAGAEPSAEKPVDEEQESEPDKKAPTADEVAADEKAEAKKQADHDAAIQKLVDTKKYELPINAVEKRRSKHFAIFGLILSVLLLLAWADIALDAGIVHVSGIKPVTHFFSN